MLDLLEGQPTAKTVLLVEDEERLRGILARYLRARGHDVIEVASAAHARQTLASERIDILLLDINLAEETGWDVLRWLGTPDGLGNARQRPSVVIVSAVPPSAKRLEQFQPDAVLNKPFPIDALARLVESDCRPVADSTGFL